MTRKIRKGLFQGAAVSALLAAILALSGRAQASIADGEPVNLDARQWESSRNHDPHIMKAPMRKKAASLALAGLFSGLVGLVGPNRALQMLLDFGRFLFRAAAYILSNPLKAAGRAAAIAGRAAKSAFKGPGRFLLIFSAIALFAFTGIAVFDQQWSIGIIVGLSLGYLAAAGIGKMRKTASNLWQKMRNPKSARPAEENMAKTNPSPRNIVIKA